MSIFDHILESLSRVESSPRFYQMLPVPQDLVDAIRDANSSKDWQAMKDAIAGWNLTCTDTTNGESHRGSKMQKFGNPHLVKFWGLKWSNSGKIGNPSATGLQMNSVEYHLFG